MEMLQYPSAILLIFGFYMGFLVVPMKQLRGLPQEPRIVFRTLRTSSPVYCPKDGY